MKRLVLIASVAAFAGFGGMASAGSLTETIVEADATSSSSGEATVLLLALLLAIPVLTD